MLLGLKHKGYLQGLLSSKRPTGCSENAKSHDQGRNSVHCYQMHESQETWLKAEPSKHQTSAFSVLQSQFCEKMRMRSFGWSRSLIAYKVNTHTHTHIQKHAHMKNRQDKIKCKKLEPLKDHGNGIYIVWGLVPIV